MPVDPILSAIVSSVVSSVVQGVLSPAPEEPAMGIIRELPEAAQKGEMLPPWRGQVQIGGTTYLLSPAVQMRNEMNMLVFPETLQAPVRVRFTTDYSGAVNRIWILSSAEARLPENR